MFSTGFNLILNSPGNASVAAGIKSKVLENYGKAGWYQKIVFFLSALMQGRSVSTSLQIMAENDLRTFVRCIGEIRTALCECDRCISLTLPDGTSIEMDFYSIRTDGNEILIDQDVSEADELMWLTIGQVEDCRTCSLSKSRLLELIDAEIAGHAETYAAIPELVAACKVEQWYRKSTAQFSEFDDQGELKEPDAIFDHLLSPANTGFHANILDIQKDLIASGAYTDKTGQYMVQLHQARLETAVSIFITEKIDMLVYEGITEDNFDAVSTALKLVSDHHAVIHGIHKQLTTKIRLLQSHYGKTNLAELPIEVKQKPVSKSIIEKVEKEGLTEQNQDAYHTVHMLLLHSALEKINREGLTGDHKNGFQSTKASIEKLPDNPDTLVLKTMLSESLQKIAATQKATSVRLYHPQ